MSNMYSSAEIFETFREMLRYFDIEIDKYKNVSSLPDGCMTRASINAEIKARKRLVEIMKPIRDNLEFAVNKYGEEAYGPKADVSPSLSENYYPTQRIDLEEYE